MYASAIRVLFECYIPIFLFPPMKLRKTLNKVKKTIQNTNPDYNIIIKRLCLYFDMKLVAFGIN